MSILEQIFTRNGKVINCLLPNREWYPTGKVEVSTTDERGRAIIKMMSTWASKEREKERKRRKK